MPVFDDMMATGGAGLLMQVHGAAEPAIYKPFVGDPFEWSVIVGQQRGGEMYDESGDVVKAIRQTVTGPTKTLIDKQIKTIQRNAKVSVAGEDWAIDMPNSQFGPSLVRVGLIRKIITRHQEMESHGAV